ncbi:MAG: hypothetical protein M1514_02575 [Patescibacteria group bacterium]|nr:hypothetical protein [Patescibacteria group bacterium]
MKRILSFALLSLFLIFLFVPKAKAEEVDDLQKKILEYEAQVELLQKQADSLTQQISLMDNQIRVTALKISQTEVQIKNLEKEIEVLSEKIVRLDGSLNFLSRVLLSRVTQAYKQGKLNSLGVLLSSASFADFINRYRYLQAVQLHDREMLLTMEQTRTSYDEQKQLKEKMQADLAKLNKQLTTQKQQLAAQVADRKNLLEETKGKEANYQKLLASARAELEAIIGILEGKGKEVKIKNISEGERIASMIAGPSCNSSGTHLHFIVTEGDQTKNPFQYLKSGMDYQNCSTSTCSGNGDPFNPSGNWNWPLNPKIIFTQGYGYTWAVQHTWVGRIYNFHNGIDMQSSSLEVKAVKSGTLYWGSYVGNCTLRYVRVHHDDGGIDTYYLHVNY